MKKKRRKRSKVRRFAGALLKLLVLAFVLCTVGAVTYVASLAADTEDVSYEGVYKHVDRTSFLYDSDGNEIDKLYYTEDREITNYDQVPDNLKNAFIAVEDKTFYKHHGFNFKRMAGAVIYKLIGRSDRIGGTSTITQQLARNVYLPDIKSQRTIRRKTIELIYAYKIENALSKEQIMEAYLNTIYLGYGCYGIDSAAKTYFSKDVPDLNLPECAALAALPQAPDTYALLQNEKSEEATKIKKTSLYANDASKERRDMVLSLMAEQGFISEEEAKEAEVDIKDILKPGFEKESGEYTYFSDYVEQVVAKDLSEKYDMTDDAAERLVYTGGLNIYSTVNRDAQHIINEEFSNDDNFPWSSEDPQAAMVITEVGTGRILAMVGGRGPVGKKLFNRATSPRQPGSSIKPLSVYSAALQKSFECEEEGTTFPFIDYGIDKQGTKDWGDYITASSRVTDEKMTVNGEVWPLNFSRKYTGKRTFRAALQQSLNTCAVKIQMQVGDEYSMEMLHKYGISTVVDDTTQPVNDVNSAALALGAMTYGATPLDMALAYGTFPNRGERCSARCYDKVTDSEGNVLLEAETKSNPVLDAGVAFIMTDLLKSVVSKGIASAASVYGVQVGGKTGTTNDTYDIWFCGFTPRYSAALWIGTDHNSEMSTTSTTAAALWSKVMQQVPGVTEGEYPEQPLNVNEKFGEYYTSGTEPHSPTYDSPGSEKKKRSSSGSESTSPHKKESKSREEWIRDWLNSN